ncbi:hypothetical protein NDU88_002600 [Pleurodeles waltl]|uniref:Uncharacterized protein n=1 Tax=Pleurodeles waltl TaxID=8319 RepID=A0AAV7RG61_PLEWA|nr:hypothetical protein NDU88_002600 [Pleurodeles waltl]
MVGDQSLQVKVRVPSEHRPEGRVRPGAVYPTSGETAGAGDAQPSTSQGAGAGWASMDEELLDYEDDTEEPVMSRKRVVVAGDVPGVVQGGHAKAHRQDVSAGNLPRGEDGFVGSLRVHELRDNLGDLSWARALNVMGGSREIRSKADASIQPDVPPPALTRAVVNRQFHSNTVPRAVAVCAAISKVALVPPCPRASAPLKSGSPLPCFQIRSASSLEKKTLTLSFACDVVKTKRGL